MLQINAAEAEKVRLKQQLLVSSSKSTYGGSGFGFEIREIPDLVFSPVAQKSLKHRKAPGTETTNSQQRSIPAIDQKFIDLFGKDLPPVVDDGDDHDVRQRQYCLIVLSISHGGAFSRVFPEVPSAIVAPSHGLCRARNRSAFELRAATCAVVSARE